MNAGLSIAVDSAGCAYVAGHAGAPTDATDTSGAPQPPDPRDPRTLVRLRKRTPSGSYEISDIEVVRAMRAWDARGARAVAMTLGGLLVILGLLTRWAALALFIDISAAIVTTNATTFSKSTSVAAFSS